MNNWNKDNEEVKAFFEERNITGIILVDYVSKWDDGFEAISNAKYNVSTNTVFDIEPASLYDDEGDEVEILLGEYIDIPNIGRFSIDDDAKECCVIEIHEIFN